MSSVSRFIRQIPLATTYYNAAEVIGVNGGNVATYVYEFVPSSSNYVGNYPNGFNDTSGGAVTNATLALQQNISQIVDKYGLSSLVLRDMGKTIFAPINSLSATAPWGYFRQVQLMSPARITQGPGFMGGTSGNTFGVLGGANTPDIYTDYLTFYIPVSVGGITGSAVNTQAFAIAGGQM
jgi:hypothetical protein